MEELNKTVIMYGAEVADEMFKGWKLKKPTTLIIYNDSGNAAGATYVRNKKKKCEELGAECIVVDIAEMDFGQLRNDMFNRVFFKTDLADHAYYIIVQRPLPAKLKLFEPAIDLLLKKYNWADIDGASNDLTTEFTTPATPLGIMRMLDYYVGAEKLDGLNAVVIGRSKIVGEPMSRLLTKANCTTTVCHTHTKNLSFYTKNADLIVCAVGQEKFLTADMIGDNRPIVVDVGINRDAEGKICGDVDFDNVAPLCSYISPVPKGVGVLTVAALMEKMGNK